MKTLVGIVTFGNVDFTRLTIDSIRESSSYDLDFFVVVGKPNDNETIAMLQNMADVEYVQHDMNYGFPASLNDIFDYAWVNNDYDNLIIAGNDIVAYPSCIDSLITTAKDTEYSCISALQYDVSNLIKDFPHIANKFEGKKLLFTDFLSRPWEEFASFSSLINVMDMRMFDIQNLCLYKREMFDVLGYVDVNFYPAYFADNDYVMRLVRSGLSYCTLSNARFFHFWSRTIKQGSGGSTTSNFDNSKKFYKKKWGGDFGNEKTSPPIKIEGRDHELATIKRRR